MYNDSCKPYLTAMIGPIEEACHTLAERVEADMPESGFLDIRLNQEFEDESKQLDIRYWWFAVHTDATKKNPNVRYLTLAGFLGGGYKIDSILHHGSNTDIIEWLRDKNSINEILITMQRLLRWCDD